MAGMMPISAAHSGRRRAGCIGWLAVAGVLPVARRCALDDFDLFMIEVGFRLWVAQWIALSSEGLADSSALVPGSGIEQETQLANHRKVNWSGTCRKSESRRQHP
ncbi:hypothetical protein D3C72_1047110 [compost metagenome]